MGANLSPEMISNLSGAGFSDPRRRVRRVRVRVGVDGRMEGGEMGLDWEESGEREGRRVGVCC